MESLKERLRKVDRLPTLPTAATRLIRALGGESTGADEIEEILKSDEAMCAAVLRAANSVAGMAETGRVFTLKESIARLGSRALTRIALSQQWGLVMAGGGAGYGLRRGELWRGAIGGAVAAETIARRTGVEEPGTAFVAGMLRDIGKLAMEWLFEPGALARDLRRRAAGVDQLAHERHLLGIDHAELGAELARIWKLPERLALAIRHHHELPRDPAASDPLHDIVHCADIVTVTLGLGSGHDGLAYAFDEAAMRRVGLDRPALETYMIEVSHGLETMLLEVPEVS